MTESMPDPVPLMLGGKLDGDSGTVYFTARGSGFGVKCIVSCPSCAMSLMLGEKLEALV